MSRIDEVVGMRVADLGRLLDMREQPTARLAGTAGQGQVYAHQAECSEAEPPATGKASTDASVRAARVPGGSAHDACAWRGNWNVTALTVLDTTQSRRAGTDRKAIETRGVCGESRMTGRVVERYWYSPYGELEAHVVVHPFDYDDDGDVDDDDYDATSSPCSGTATVSLTRRCGRSPRAACGTALAWPRHRRVKDRRLDADADGDVDSADQTIIAAYIATLDSDTELQRIPASTHSRRGNPFGHQGLVLDAELASYQNRMRQYAPKAKRFMQRDPHGLKDGMSLYSSVRNRPIHFKDPMGTIAQVWELPDKYNVFMSVVWFGSHSYSHVSAGLPAWKRASQDFQAVWNVPGLTLRRGGNACKPAHFWVGNWVWLDPDDECNQISVSLSPTAYDLKVQYCADKARAATGQSNGVYLDWNTRTNSPACGAANVDKPGFNPQGPHGSGWIDIDCMYPGHTAAHELGHLMGLGHDMADAQSPMHSPAGPRASCTNVRDVLNMNLAASSAGPGFYNITGPYKCCSSNLARRGRDLSSR